MGFDVFDYIARKKAGMGKLSQQIAENLEPKAKSGAKWEDGTGDARKGLKSGYEGGLNEHTIYITHEVSYGQILEEGSKPHVITPKNGEFLYWKGANHIVKTKKVNHPGTKGFHTIEDTFNSNRNEIFQMIEKYWSD